MSREGEPLEGHLHPGPLVPAPALAGTWRYDRRPEGLRITLSPFAPLTRGATRAVERQAKAVAKFFGLELAALDWVDI